MYNTDKALVVVDMQNDFCNDGSLGVPDVFKIIPIINQYIEFCSNNGYWIIATRDWHPSDSKHFKSGGGLWPRHCVQDTEGAEFHKDIHFPEDTIVISKGLNDDKEGYSAFQGVDAAGLEFHKVLKGNGIKELFVGGIATEYCVKNTIFDAIKANLFVTLLKDAVKEVDFEDSFRVISEMRRFGVKETTFEELKA